MVFSNILPTTQLVLPTGGSQTSGSGTTVIGGPLPAELIAAGYTGSGIIWYSTDNTFRYEFIVQSNATIVIGIVDNSGAVIPGTTTGTSTARIGSPRGASNSYLTIAAGSTCALYLRTGTTGASTVVVSASTTDGYMTNSTGLTDRWATTSFSGSFGGATYNGVIDYFVAFDRSVELRYNITYSVATTSAGNLIATGVVPVAAQPTSSPNGLNITGNYNSNKGVGVALMGGGSPANLALLSVVIGTTVTSGSMAYHTAKPTF